MIHLLARCPISSEKTRQGAPDGLGRDPPPCKPLLEARLRRDPQSPKAGVVSELLPRGAVEHLPQSLGTLLVEGVAGSFGARGSGNESIQEAPLVEIVWMASRTVCCPQPRLWAICGACSPLELARSIWHRCMVKVSLERSPAWRASRSSSENERTKIGVFMDLTVTRNLS